MAIELLEFRAELATYFDALKNSLDAGDPAAGIDQFARAKPPPIIRWSAPNN
jgi:hypothetical protein